ncbi:MAG: non-homologous end-joining DNA ligase [Myxococcaceae bacterium]
MPATSRQIRNRAVAPDALVHRFTRLDKVLWPDEGFTKGDLVRYALAIAPWALPYLRDRPLAVERWPDGLSGHAFFQKHAPSHTPAWVRTELIASEEGAERCFVCDDARTLAWLANLAAIPLHVWSSRVASLERPDWCILDLDPKRAPFSHVVTLALAARQLCGELGLPVYVKASGSSGLHVLVPLGRQLEHPASVALAQLLCEVLVRRHPGLATVARNPRARGEKVYLDAFQNGRGKLLVAPFSVRPLPGMPVSMPLRWSEVNAQLGPRDYTAANAVARMRRLRKDPLLGVLTDRPDLERAFGRLEKLLGA